MEPLDKTLISHMNILLSIFFSDIHSISNVLTSEFQASILLRCQGETEQSLVDYLCHGQGLLLLQMLCILANKVWLKMKKQGKNIKALREDCAGLTELSQNYFLFP